MADREARPKPAPPTVVRTPGRRPVGRRKLKLDTPSSPKIGGSSPGGALLRTPARHGGRSSAASSARGVEPELELPRERLLELLAECGLYEDVDAVSSALDTLYADGDDLTADDVLQALSPGHVVSRALKGELAVPDWKELCTDLRSLHAELSADDSIGGAPASYIPILAEVDPRLFSVSVTTVDGQTFSCGDTGARFSLQSCVKPLLYASALEELGLDAVHRHVGSQPSGLPFNDVSLNGAGLPHNPMMNNGGLATAALLRRDLSCAARFRNFLNAVHAAAGGREVKFSNPVYLCEQETAYRNQAILYLMQEAGVFPPATDVADVLDFYMQCCSIEVDTLAASNIAATLAGGGVEPLTRKRCASVSTTKSVLTLMFSCGMYDYSWCPRTGLPAKSGVSGLVYVVVPNRMGIAVYSPLLDALGNSAKAVSFIYRLLARWDFGIFAQLARPMRRAAVAAPPAAHEPAAGSLRASGAAGGEEEEEGDGSHGSSLLPPKRPPLMRAASVREVATRVRHRERWRVLLRKLGRLKREFNRLDSDGSGAVPLDSMLALLRRAGLRDSHPQLRELLSMAVVEEGILRFQHLFVRLPQQDEHTDNLFMKALLNGFVVPDFAAFAEEAAQLFAAVQEDDSVLAGEKKVDDVYAPYSCDEEGALDRHAFSISICTVDGQQLQLGADCGELPLSCLSKAVLYAAALQDCGLDAVNYAVGQHTTAADPSSFLLHKADDSVVSSSSSLAHTAVSAEGDETEDDSRDEERDAKGEEEEEGDKEEEAEEVAATGGGGHGHGGSDSGRLQPMNPFMDIGALVVCSLLMPGSSTFTRYRYLLNRVSALASDGVSRLTFNQSMYLSLNARALRAKALAHYAKGMGCLPDRAAPEAMVSTFFNACSIELGMPQLATLAATMAGMGENPFSGQRCFSLPVAQQLLSMLYNCGLNQFTGQWAFSVGIPAVAAPNGTVLMAIPNVMGIAIHSPPCNSFGVSLRAFAFAQALAASHNVHLFDQLVFNDRDVAGVGAAGIASSRRGGSRSVPAEAVQRKTAFYCACMAAAAGDFDRLQQLLEDWPSLAKQMDADRRTALHVAASSGHTDLCALLLHAGADVGARDGRGNRPVDEARSAGYDDVVALLAKASGD
eukprot:PLAT7220.1.p1 GENE.PLAT7220.1~~PLAT7220.1.p1  ORF type:complete len:1129 (+),score=456.08 PLAT7220.1:41-3427(+)